ncbi:MAG: cysteine-rich CWC family protein [Tenuifilaceae bacterium]|nr:cysteine-rich CWC family protein [Tenuifilaceae bacterium]
MRFRFCPRCNALFDCYCESDRECWCTSVKLSANQLRTLAEKYCGCLCPSCLTAKSDYRAEGETKIAMIMADNRFGE